MTNTFSLFRSLVIYAICLPLAIWLGYLLATPYNLRETILTVVIPLCLLSVPMLLRWHYPWMIACWNLDAILFFIPGRPAFWTLLIGVSLLISVLQYIMNRQLKFLSVPSITKPLIFFAVVILLTARLTGGIGINALGSGDNVGGRRYIWLLIAIMGYFAITAQRIPIQKARLYTTLFFIGFVSFAIGSSAGMLGQGLNFIYQIFPPDSTGYANVSQDAVSGPAAIARFGGLSTGALGITYLLLTRYGVEGVMRFGKIWRPLLCLVLLFICLFGGYRSMAINLLLTVSILFCLEGLLRSHYLPIVILCFVLGAAVMLPFADKLPMSIQRSLTFLPIHLDPEAEQNAKGSTEWRLEMWREALPLVPKYLILGKGYGMSLSELNKITLPGGASDSGGAALAGDYHNGPLSVIIPFGIFGVIGFIWFLVAGGRVMYRNYKFGDPLLERINRFLLAYYLMKIIMFFTVFGSLYSDFVGFTGLVGLSVALNGGLRVPAAEPTPRPVLNKFKFASAAR